MDLTTNGVVITDAIKFVQTNKEKLTAISTKEDNNGNKESRGSDCDREEDEDELEEEQEEERVGIDQKITNQVF